MRVSSLQLHAAVPAQPRKSAAPPADSARPVDQFLATESLSPGAVPFLSAMEDVDEQPFSPPDSPPPRLPRPVLMLHGFNGKADRWGNLVDWLTSGEEPVNRDGGLLRAGEQTPIDADANLFSLAFSRPYNSVESNAAELAHAIDRVRQATGSDEVDLITHSLGGLDARFYLQQADEHVARVVMMAPPNHGSQLADLELVFREKFGYPIAPPVDDPEVRRVLNQLKVDKVDGDGEASNPFLHELNEQWDNQREHANVLIMTANGVPTMTSRPGVTVWGDGVVTRRSAVMPDVPAKHVWFRTHGGIQNSAKVMEESANFLAGLPLSPETELYEHPEDAQRVQELLEARGEAAQPDEYYIAC